MANDTKVDRILHVKVRTHTSDARQLLSVMKTAIPFYEAFGDARIRLLQNVDEPGQFIQVVHYRMDATIELNRQKVASDLTMRNIMQAWRTLLPGAAEIDVYEDVTDIV
jgi:hypothetical protein